MYDVIVEAEKHLTLVDQVMADLITKHGKCPFAEWTYKPFDSLVRAIISQQLSAKSSASIERKLSLVVSLPYTPENLLSVSFEDIRKSGLSSTKTRYILELARKVVDGHIDFDDLLNHSDESVIVNLTKFAGIGRWTAEMFLIFGLRRLDVLALGDAGLQRAAKTLYQGTESSRVLEKVSCAWKPYRSVASWYLWKFLDS